MTYKFILGIDPSGSFSEGKGTTGLCLLHQDNKNIQIISLEQLKAISYDSMEAYWHAHLKLLHKLIFISNRQNKLIIVMEDFLLYGNRAASQINSRMETSKLIGVIQHWCYMNNIPYTMQSASLVKQRWADSILEYKGYLKKVNGKFNINEHMRDSLRHAVHYATFKNKEV